MFKLTGKRCFWCDIPLVLAIKDFPANLPLPNSQTKDHLVPKARRGRKKVACCYECNQLKGGMDPFVFRSQHRPHVSERKIRDALAGQIPIENQRQRKEARRRIRRQKENIMSSTIVGYISTRHVLTRRNPFARDMRVKLIAERVKFCRETPIERC